MLIPVVGFDPSLRNWGIARALLDPQTGELSQVHLDLVQPVLASKKQVRQNSLDLDAAQQHADKALAYAQEAKAVFVEVPVGSQNARAAASYGICIGVLGTLRALGLPFFLVTPDEVKLAATGVKTATKQQMIQWASTLYPKANWPTERKQGQLRIVEGKAEHMADALAAIHAGFRSPPFQQVKPFLQAA